MKKFKKIMAVVLASSMLLSAAACGDAGSKKKSKKDKGGDVDIIMDAAEEYTDALKDFDFKKIKKLSTDIDKDMIDDFQDLYETNEDAYDVVFDSVKFDIDEDSAEFDGEEGSVDVKFTYDGTVMLEDITDSDEDEDSKGEGKFTIDFEIDDDEALVSNADKVVDKFYTEVMDSLNITGGISMIEPEDDIVNDLSMEFYVSAIEYSIGGTDSFQYRISTFDDGEFDGVEATVVLLDPNEKVLYTTKINIKTNADTEYSISPADAGVTKFPDGFYTLTVTIDEYDISDDTYFDVDDDYANGTGTIDTEDDDIITSGISGNCQAPSEEKLGRVEGTVYYNDYFGLKFDVGSDVKIMTEDELESFGPRDAMGLYLDFASITGDISNVKSGVALFITEVPSTDGSTLKLTDPQDGSTFENYGGIEFIVSPDGSKLIAVKDNAIMYIDFDVTSADEIAWRDAVIESIANY